MRWLAKLGKLPREARTALIEAVICLGFARLLLLVPFRWLRPLLGRQEHAAPQCSVTLTADQRAAASLVRQWLLCAADRLPWHSTCLVRALAGHMMLRRRHLPAVLSLGVRVGAPELAAHAWLRCGEADVVGAETAPEFTAVAAFVA